MYHIVLIKAHKHINYMNIFNYFRSFRYQDSTSDRMVSLIRHHCHTSRGCCKWLLQ